MPCILIVHRADAAICDEVRVILEHAGYTTEVSATAVAYAYTQSLQPDLVLFTGLTELDVRVLALLRQDARTAGISMLVCAEDAQRLPPTLPPHTTTLLLPIQPAALLAAVAARIHGAAPDRR